MKTLDIKILQFDNTSPIYVKVSDINLLIEYRRELYEFMKSVCGEPTDIKIGETILPNTFIIGDEKWQK